MDNYQIRFLHSDELRQMHRTFTEAFKGYPVPMSLTYYQFRERFLNRLNLRFDLSVGAFSGEKLVGFVFHTQNLYRGELVIYNGGTGVIPGHRGNNLTTRMYQKLIAHRPKEAKKCVLEVITTNSYAREAYDKAGFQETKLLKCYKISVQPFEGKTHTEGVTLAEGNLENKEKYRSFDTYPSSFADSYDQLIFNEKAEKVIECLRGGTLIGYLIFQPSTGRINRIGVSEGHRRKGVGSWLLGEAYRLAAGKPLYVVNVPDEAIGIHQFLVAAGFKNELDQWEMELLL